MPTTADINTYDIGDTARLSATFQDLNGLYVDPTTVTVKIKDPAGVITSTAAVSKDAVGKYHYDLPLTTAGYYYYRFIGTGANPGAARRALYVAPSDF